MDPRWLMYLPSLLPFFALMVMLVFFLARHQQRMALIFNKSSTDHSEIESLRREVSELKSLLLNHMAADSRPVFNTPPAVPDVERLTVGH